MKKNIDSDLKLRAKLARDRLRQGFYLKKEQELQDAIECAKNRGFGVIADISNCKKLDVKREIELARSKTLEADEVFYKKVVALLQDDIDIIDPIGKLVDREVFDALSATARQKYILDLSAKFREMSERYQKECIYGK